MDRRVVVKGRRRGEETGVCHGNGEGEVEVGEGREDSTPGPDVPPTSPHGSGSERTKTGVGEGM